jgi:signal peptidase II
MNAPARRGPIAPATLLVAALVVLLDQLTKAWAVDRLRGGDDIDVFWTLRMHYSENTGMAFSRGQSWGPVIAVVAMLIVVGLLVTMRRGANPATGAAVGLVIGGALGNLVDRLLRSPGWLRGAVVDFIDLQWFPIFNVADMGITIGGVLLVLLSWRDTRRQLAERTEVTS